jgi:hypothetical protein
MMSWAQPSEEKEDRPLGYSGWTALRREQCGVLLKAGISKSERLSIARQQLGNQVSCIIVWVTNTFTWQCIHRKPTVRRCESMEVFSWMDKFNPWRCSLSSRQRILLRGWLTELTDREGSDNEMSGSEENAGQEVQNSQEWSCKFVTTVVITVNVQINRDQIRSQQLYTFAET